MRECLYDRLPLTPNEQGRFACENHHEFTDELLDSFTDDQWGRLARGRKVKFPQGDLRFRNGVFQKTYKPGRRVVAR